jgi:hypothetical protein
MCALVCVLMLCRCAAHAPAQTHEHSTWTRPLNLPRCHPPSPQKTTRTHNQVYERYPARFNILHVSCALARLADLTSARLAGTAVLQSERAALDAFVKALLAEAAALAPSADGPTAAALLHSMARLAATRKVCVYVCVYVCACALGGCVCVVVVGGGGAGGGGGGGGGAASCTHARVPARARAVACASVNTSRPLIHTHTHTAALRAQPPAHCRAAGPHAALPAQPQPCAAGADCLGAQAAGIRAQRGAAAARAAVLVARVCCAAGRPRLAPGCCC